MNTHASYNIIGDIHGRSCWENLVREDSVNIFVGDYLDSYENISPAEQMYNFQKIIDFKHQRPETVLLYGNHDLHYLISSEHYSRYNPIAAPEYRQALMENKSLFYGIAYPIGEIALVTHAGVTKEWYEKYFGSYQSESLLEVVQKINELWNQDKNAFTFDVNATEISDHYGTSPTHSPVWIRPKVLVKHDLFCGTVKQIVGHTQTEAGVTKDHNIICVDCLGTKERSYLLDS